MPGLRLAPAVANGIATINRLAPGRCIIGLGTGHTGMRMLGQKPMRLAPFREYVRVVRALLDGDEAEYTLDGETPPRSAFRCASTASSTSSHRIPLYVAAFGPKAQALAGELGRRADLGLPRGGTVPRCWPTRARGAARGRPDAARGLPRSPRWSRS